MLHAHFWKRFAFLATVRVFRSILADNNPAFRGLLRNPNLIPDARFLKIKRMEHIGIQSGLACNIGLQSLKMRRAEVLVLTSNFGDDFRPTDSCDGT